MRAEMERWYFAYGSNMCGAQMFERTGSCSGADWPRVAWLANHRVAFNTQGDDGEIYANLVASGDGVYGVLYRCTAQALQELDEFECGYDRQDVVVIGSEGVPLHAIAYVARPETLVAEAMPSASYLKTILSGARGHSLPESYIESLCKGGQG